ncbi:hypothetical protein VTO42DRAFT_388 [Malbranchea cinnamomea]
MCRSIFHPKISLFLLSPFNLRSYTSKSLLLFQRRGGLPLRKAAGARYLGLLLKTREYVICIWLTELLLTWLCNRSPFLSFQNANNLFVVCCDNLPLGDVERLSWASEITTGLKKSLSAEELFLEIELGILHSTLFRTSYPLLLSRKPSFRSHAEALINQRFQILRLTWKMSIMSGESQLTIALAIFSACFLRPCRPSKPYPEMQTVTKTYRHIFICSNPVVHNNEVVEENLLWSHSGAHGPLELVR